MSYILEALRRADVERERDRERGQVPGINAQPGTTAAAPDRARRSTRSAVWMALGISLGALAVWAMGSLRSGPALPPAAGLTQPGLADPVPADRAPPAVSLVLPPPGVVPPPAPMLVVVAPPLLPAVAAGAPARAPPTGATARPLASAPARATPLAELTPEMRRDWPPLVVGGAIHSENTASRFIIINGQVVREGEAAAPGVSVERIGNKSAILRWREMRVEVPF